MRSRERVLKAINHEEPDRIPIDVGGTRQSGIAALTYHELKDALGLKTPTRVFDVYQMIAEIERPVMERLGADCVGLNRLAVAFGIENREYRPWQFPVDGGPIVEVPVGFQPVKDGNRDLLIVDAGGETIAKMPAGGLYFDRLNKYPGAAHLPAEEMSLPLISDEELDHLAQQAEAYEQNTDFAVIAQLGPAYELFWGMGTGDFPGWMMTLATEPDYVHSLYQRLAENWIENLKRFHAAVGDRIQVLQFNDDLGTQDAPFLSEKMFRELVMPYYKRGLDWVHANTPWKVFMHNDGSLAPLIPSLIEMGVDILNPVQTTATNMDPVMLKREFGDQLVFWGGSCDCQSTLPFGAPEDVSREVTEHVQALAPGGGYVFASVHNIQAHIPPANVLAMFDTARSVGVYPIHS